MELRWAVFIPDANKIKAYMETMGCGLTQAKHDLKTNQPVLEFYDDDDKEWCELPTHFLKNKRY
jgi:hypothetical protein